MKVVSRFEASLLRILHFFLGHAPLAQALPLVQSRCQRPPCLSRTAVGLVEDTLAKGCTLFLARTGGWRKERFVRGPGVAGGRLWERTAPVDLGLQFSGCTLEFLQWITAQDPREATCTLDGEPTPADCLLLFQAYTAIRGEKTELEALAGQPIFVGNPLCRLAYPDDFPSGAVDTTTVFEAWTDGAGAAILEALQPLLAERWVRLESSKARMSDWRVLCALGDAQAQVLEEFLGAVERANRLDLAGFLLQASARLLTPGATPHLWVNESVRLAPQRMADRTNVQRAGLALLRQMARFRDWEQRARGVGYFDENYQASQLVKDAWERFGADTLHGRAQAIIRELDPLRVQDEDRT